MQIQAVRLRSLREHVADALRNLIISGEMKPGDCLRDTELAGQLKTSRGPVREALLQLEKESLVRNAHNRGWFVIELTEDEVSQIISLRMALEAIALREAGKRVTPDGLVESLRRFERLCELARRDEMVELLRADFEFHQNLWGLAGHPLLREELIRISTPYFAYQQATIRRTPVPPGHFETTALQHKRIVEYLEDPSHRRAEEILEQHFRTLGVAGWDRLVKSDTRPGSETGG
ncbi:MAG: GntR family transcriptional regulator [Bryobacteraceae bacterium]